MIVLLKLLLWRLKTQMEEKQGHNLKPKAIVLLENVVHDVFMSTVKV